MTVIEYPALLFSSEDLRSAFVRPSYRVYHYLHYLRRNPRRFTWAPLESLRGRIARARSTDDLVDRFTAN